MTRVFADLPKGTRCRPPWLMWSWVKIGWCRAQYYGMDKRCFVWPWELVEIVGQ